MKNIIKKILVLTFAAILFVMPASNALAFEQPVNIFNSDDTRIYEFQPSLELAPGESIYLLDYLGGNAGYWYVPSGKTFHFMCYFEENTTTLRFTYRSTSSYDPTDIDLADGWPSFSSTFSPRDYEDYYLFKVTNIGDNTVNIYNFKGQITD